MDAVVLVTSVSRKVPFPKVRLTEETENVTKYCKGYNCQWKGYYQLVNSTKYFPG
jgi:hypothetical protein